MRNIKPFRFPHGEKKRKWRTLHNVNTPDVMKYDTLNRLQS